MQIASRLSSTAVEDSGWMNFDWLGELRVWIMLAWISTPYMVWLLLTLVTGTCCSSWMPVAL